MGLCILALLNNNDDDALLIIVQGPGLRTMWTLSIYVTCSDKHLCPDKFVVEIHINLF